MTFFSYNIIVYTFFTGRRGTFWPILAKKDDFWPAYILDEIWCLSFTVITVGALAWLTLPRKSLPRHVMQPLEELFHNESSVIKNPTSTYWI